MARGQVEKRYRMKSANVIDALISPLGHLEVLSYLEVGKLRDTTHGGLYDLFRNCALAVLNSGSSLDDGKELLERHRDFSIQIVQRPRGVKLQLTNAPARAFVDGQMVRGINEHLFAVLRDVIYVDDEVRNNPTLDLTRGEGVTDAVFRILRNAGVVQARRDPNMVVCWGGHSITRKEYSYTKEVGYQLGLRGLDICTGCGPGAMKGPMKGAAVGHAKQRICDGRYLGITEPGIIASESPNPIVNELVVMPDIEKRLEAFVRVGHGFIVFPGGVGTAEELLHLLGILLHPENVEVPFPLVLTGPASARDYFEQIDEFIGATLGEAARRRYRIILDDPTRVAQTLRDGIAGVREYRKEQSDAYHFNWKLVIDEAFQRPFAPKFENMANLQLHLEQPPHQVAANLRRAFSGVVAGNVKAEGISEIEKYGPFELKGDPALMARLDKLLRAFVVQQRMKLPGKEYVPCFRVSQG